MKMNDKIKYLVFYILILCFGLFSVTTFSWKGNPPLKWNEIGGVLPIMAICGAIGCLILYFNDKK